MDIRSVFLTREGRYKLEQELEHLTTVRRKEISDYLHQVLPESSLLEDGELENALNEQAFLEERIRRLKDILSDAVTIEEGAPCGVVVPGSYVTVVDLAGDGAPESYRIVGSAEADPTLGGISNESPLGRALLGRQAGEETTIKAPDGDFTFKIVQVHPTSEEGTRLGRDRLAEGL